MIFELVISAFINVRQLATISSFSISPTLQDSSPSILLWLHL
jgi:hypothetical protein